MRFLPALAKILAPPDPLLLIASWRSEILHARGRVLVVAVLLVLVLLRFSDHINSGALPALTLAVAAVAIGVSWLLMRGIVASEPTPGLSMLSTAIDITLVSLILFGLQALGHPNAAVNSRAIYAVYFLAIISTTMRFSPRLCVATGLLAMAQYGLVVYLAAVHPARDLGWDAVQYGTIVPIEQVYRVLLLGIASLVATLTVIQARDLLDSSARDGLTGLFNRRSLDTRLEFEIARARREAWPLSVVLLDVDDFKSFNDQHGHPAGDRALRSLSATLRAAFRSSDIVTRYGGEEFAILLPGAGVEETLPRIEAALDQFGQLELGSAEAPGRLTCSAGLVQFTPLASESGLPPKVTGDQLVSRADQLLLSAKARGKKQVLSDVLAA